MMNKFNALKAIALALAISAAFASADFFTISTVPLVETLPLMLLGLGAIGLLRYEQET